MSTKHVFTAALFALLTASGAAFAQSAAQPSIQPATPAFESNGKPLLLNAPAYSPNDGGFAADRSKSLSELPSNPKPSPSISPALGGSGPLDIAPVDSGSMSPPPTGSGAR